MPASAFRRGVEALAKKHPRDARAFSTELAAWLRQHNLPRRRQWEQPHLLPAVVGVWERSLGDAGLVALGVCTMLELQMDLGLVRRGLLVGDTQALAWIASASASARPS